jgi:hypothetical protein
MRKEKREVSRRVFVHFLISHFSVLISRMGSFMALGPIIAMLLRALPDILFLWRRRAETHDKEQIHEDVQDFRAALEDDSGQLDAAADLLERRLREAGRVPQRGA